MRVKQWAGALHNTEPAKCDELAWYPLTALPPNAIPYIRQALTGYQQGQSYSELGWES